MPRGPWLVVLGMHRSGTSALTGALGCLGFQMPAPEDRVSAPESNEEHWESRSLVLANERLLDDLGGSWDAPPPSESVPEEAAASAAIEAASVAFTGCGPIAWKDPRNCLLLRWWKKQLPAPLCAVFIWRRPRAVARSLERRDGLAFVDGLALWERYNRCALRDLEGTDTYVMRYEDLVANVTKEIESLVQWLRSLGRFSSPQMNWDIERAGAQVKAPQSARATADPAGESPLWSDQLQPEQLELLAELESLAGPHAPLGAAGRGAESPWTTSLLEHRRLARSGDSSPYGVRASLEQVVSGLELQVGGQASVIEAQNSELAEAKLVIARQDEQIVRQYEQIQLLTEQVETLHKAQEALMGSTSWRVTRPLRAIGHLASGSGRSRPAPGEDHGGA